MQAERIAVTFLAMIVASALVPVPASAQLIKCKKPDGSLYIGPSPPEGCTIEKSFDSNDFVLSIPKDPSSSAGAAFEQIKKNCAAEWPSDYTMQVYCSNQQLEAAHSAKCNGRIDLAQHQRRCANLGALRDSVAGEGWRL